MISLKQIYQRGRKGCVRWYLLWMLISLPTLGFFFFAITCHVLSYFSIVYFSFIFFIIPCQKGHRILDYPPISSCYCTQVSFKLKASTKKPLVSRHGFFLWTSISQSRLHSNEFISSLFFFHSPKRPFYFLFISCIFFCIDFSFFLFVFLFPFISLLVSDCSSIQIASLVFFFLSLLKYPFLFWFSFFYSFSLIFPF